MPAELVPDRPEIVTGISCPEDIERRPGRVTCDAEVGGVPVSVAVDIDDRGRALLSTDDVFLVDAADLARRVAQRLEADLGPAAVACDGPVVLAAAAGEELVCSAVDSYGARHSLVVTITSEDGDWRLRFG